MTEVLLVLALALEAVVAVLVVVLMLRRPVDLAPLHNAIAAESARSRDEAQTSARSLRDEVGTRLQTANDSLVATLTRVSANQQSQLDNFAGQLERFILSQKQTGQEFRQEMATQIRTLTDTLDKRFEALRTATDTQLKAMQQDNERKLEQMRLTVDEKLQTTLEKRLGESFKTVSERLEEVHKGLGEMRTLATGVGDLKKVLSNVKARGTWGEVQLGNLLEQTLTPEQYACNVAVREGSAARVEFAIRLPGRDADQGRTVWLPIDAKFPVEDYQRLVDASERGDAEAMAQAGRDLEARVRGCARDIREKYIAPPATTDFALMFLPYEGLFAEVVRRPGLAEALQRDFRVTVAGPTTLSALLNSLQLGFRTLAIEQRSSEVWQVLGAVKTEFARFGEVIGKVKKKLDEASSQIETVGTRTRAIERKLRDVQALPDPNAPAPGIPAPANSAPGTTRTPAARPGSSALSDAEDAPDADL